MYQAFTWTSGKSGSFWKDLGERAERLEHAGFTLVWLPPPCKGAGGAEDVGYALYDLYDLGEFEQKGSTATRWGTRQQLEACTAKLREAGIMPLADIVLNHRMGADETERFHVVAVSNEDRGELVGEPFEIEAYTKWTFPGRGGTHSEFGWRWEHLTAIDQPASTEDEEAGDTKLYRVAAKDFAQDVGIEHGNYDFLMGCDIDLTREDVREELYRWGRWLIETSGVEGFRIDAAKHMSAGFIRDWLSRLREDTGRDLFSVCEFAIGELGPVTTFLDRTGGSTHVFDHILHFSFGEASRDREGFDLRKDVRRIGGAGAPSPGRDLRGQPRFGPGPGQRRVGGRLVQAAGLRGDPAAGRGAALRIRRRLRRAGGGGGRYAGPYIPP